MIRLVYAFPLFPSTLTVGAEELLQLMVVVNTHKSLVVLVAQPDRTALALANRPARAWVDVVTLRVWAVAYEAAIVHRIQAWLLAHIDPVPACPHSRDNCSLMILISSFIALMASMFAL